MEDTTQAQAADVVVEAAAPVAVAEAPVTETPVATEAPKVATVEENSTEELTADDTAKYEAKLRKALTEVKNLRGTKSQLAQEVEALRKEAEAVKATASAGEDAKTQLQMAQEALKAARIELALGKSATRVIDPALAVKLIDQSKIVWSEDGSADLSAAIDALIEAHPVLAATPGKPTAVGMVSAPVRNTDPTTVDQLEGLKGPALLDALNRLARGR
jgi:outer membrane murein-binding lipoprotein Lpp